MINRKNIWFLTLFSLILALSVYYVTMPSETLLDVYSNVYSDEDVTEVADVIAVHRLENETKVTKELDLLKMKLVDTNISVEEKNAAYDKIRDINNKKTLESEIEKQINEKLKLNSFVKIEDDKITVFTSSQKYDTALANKIMKLVQSNFKETKYVTVKFE